MSLADITTIKITRREGITVDQHGWPVHSGHPFANSIGFMEECLNDPKSKEALGAVGPIRVSLASQEG